MTTATPFPVIPPPQLQVFRNLSGFDAFVCDKMAPGRALTDVVTLKGSFELRPDVVEETTPNEIQLADRVHDAERAELSSLAAAGEVMLEKPTTDLYLTGHARTHDGRPRDRWVAGVAARSSRGPVVSHALVATGPRTWTHRLGLGWKLGDPTPAAAVPLRYELAWGGAYPAGEDARWVTHEPNPSGRGFVSEAELARHDPLPAPQWELPDHPTGRPGHPRPLAGFGPIARPWSSRLRHAGTYDQAWLTEAHRARERGELVDYPGDFDPRFFLCGPEALQAEARWEGDERIVLEGLVEGHERLFTQLPGVRLLASVTRGARVWAEEPIPLDTVHIDLDAGLVHLIWRLALPHARGIRGVVVGREDAS
ncbi:MAG: DUF2169 domain-containing protein [Sandaracinaceae bacterium]|nr:MAG: DUF2169 domain-containing protein [Sandaracinaceae bacterium]